MDTETFEQGLAQQMSAVFGAHPELRDHRRQHPWLTGSLGDPFAGIWFVAEAPSLRSVERITADPGGGMPTKEAQWYATNGDRLFRESLVDAGFKDGAWVSPGGWRCYITNVIKNADYVGQRKQKGSGLRRELAERWAPVLQWELDESRPRLVVMMGGQVANLLNSLQVHDFVKLTATTLIESYAYIAKRPRGKLRPVHPRRVADYRASFETVRMLFG